MDQTALIEAYRKDLELRGMKTSRLYVSWIKHFARFYGGDKDLTLVTKEDLKAFLQELRDRKLLISSIKAIFIYISAFFEFLTDEGLIPSNPVPPFRKKYLRVYKKTRSREKQIITIGQAKMLVNSILDVRDRTIVLLFLKTGMRRGELISLDVMDVDLEEMTIRLKTTPKRSNLMVFFDEETRDLLRLWIEEYRPARAKKGEPSLFVTRKGRISDTAVEALVIKAAKNVGLHNPHAKDPKDRFTPHCCRHWFTTHLRRAGMSREFIQELRGDARRDAIDIYDHIDKKELKNDYLAKIPGLGIH